MSTEKQKRYKNSKPNTFLIVEQDTFVGEVLIELLKQYDHASQAESAKQALQAIGREPSDIIP